MADRSSSDSPSPPTHTTGREFFANASQITVTGGFFANAAAFTISAGLFNFAVDSGTPSLDVINVET